MRAMTDTAAQERELLLQEQAARREDTERAVRYWQILAEASRVLASTLDYGEALRQVARFAAGEVADLCVVDLLEGETFTRVAWAHADPSTDAALEELGQFHVPCNSEHPNAVACREGRAVLLPLDEAGVARCALSREHRAVIGRMGVRHVLSAPLVARGRTLGVMAFADSGDRLHHGPSRALAEELANRVALAVDNAKLYEQTRVAARRRDEVLGIVSHDLRNPLNVIVMMLAALRRDPVQSPERMQKRLDAMERSADRMSQLIQDLVDVTRIEGSGLKLHLEASPVADVAEEARRSIAALAQSRSLTLGIDVQAGLPEPTLDRRRIQQVLANLLRNAVQNTEAGGTVRLAVDQQGTMLRFVVSDTGVGLAPEDVSGIFERFWQGRRGADGNMGLGLAIARGIVEAHGGWIDLASERGVGTRVTFAVPFAPEPV